MSDQEKVNSTKFLVDGEHTPGPWTVVDTNYGDVIVQTLAPVPESEDHSYGRRAIVGSSEWTYCRGEDARLIAAAPELLVACKRLVELDLRIAQDPVENNNQEILDEALTIAKFAICKATMKAYRDEDSEILEI